jgi:hypothetical protein
MRYCIIALLFTLQSQAQHITGRIQDQQQQPLPFVLVVLSTDSSFSKILGTALTNDSGHYTLTVPDKAPYLLRASAMGYNTYVGTAHDITLTNTSTELNTIIVKGQKPTFQKQADKFVFNVANSNITTGASAHDVLKHTPLLVTNSDGSLHIAGFPSAAIVYINNRRSTLTGDDLMNYLKGMPADNIISVEVITNPSAKYEAGASGGIINIMLKKTEDEGLNSTLTLSSRQNRFNEQKASAVLNYKKKRYSQQLQLSGTNARDYYLLDANTVYPSLGQQESIYTVSDDRDKQAAVSTAINYELSGKSNIGGAVEYRHKSSKSGANTINYVNYSTHTDSLLNTTTQPGENSFISANLYYKYNNALDINIDAVSYSNHNNSTFLSYYQDGQLFNGYQSNIKQDIRNYSIKADYAHAFLWKTTLEAGAKYTYTQTKNPYNFYNLEAGDKYTYNPAISNYFIYEEKILAAYLNLQRTLAKKITVKAGVRVEDTRTNRNNYTRWFPYGNVNYAVNEDHNISVAIKVDFKRPFFWQMNPFTTYASNKTGARGNPFLQPTQNLHAELTYVLHKDYVFMASYGHEKNLFNQVATLIPPDTMIYYWDNYGYSRSFSLISVINKPIVKDLWTASITNSLEWRTLNVTANGVASKHTYPLYILNINNTFTNIVHTGIDATLTGTYVNRYAQSNMTIRAFGNIDIGLSRSFAKPDIRVALAIEDILFTNYYRISTLQNDQMMNYAIVKANSRLLRLSVTKKFGNKKMKRFNANDRGNIQEKNRI